jgi:proteasome lid subunit RPN8/RPN11
MRDIILNEDHKAIIKAIALHTPEVETCGVITKDEVIPLANTAESPDTAFMFDPDQWSAVSDRAIAIYHSHCSRYQPGQLSPGDIENSVLFGLPYVLYHTAFDCWDYYDPKHTHPYPLKIQHPENTLEYYLGWQFEWGRSDCAALVRGFFEGFLGLPVGTFTRVDFTRLDGDRTFTSALEGAGFVDVSARVREEGLVLYDVPLMSLRSWDKGEHIGIIWTAGNMPRILHHTGGDRLSEHVPYDEFWQRKTLKVFRHEKLL